jgi:hypothetical protein
MTQEPTLEPTLEPTNIPTVMVPARRLQNGPEEQGRVIEYKQEGTFQIAGAVGEEAPPTTPLSMTLAVLPHWMLFGLLLSVFLLSTFLVLGWKR